MAVNIKRSNENLRLWIQTQHLIEESKQLTIETCFKTILSLFGSHKDLIKALIKSVDTNKLNSIYKMIKEENIKQIENEKKVENEKQIQKEEKIDIRVTTLDAMPVALIEYICSMLHRDEILQFKATSSIISVVCLNEMTKYQIPICNANSLMKKVYLERFHWKTNKIIKWKSNRYDQNINNVRLLGLFEKRYDIKQSDQIPILLDTDFKIHPNIKYYDKIKPNVSLMIFDRNNITMLDSKSFRTLNENDLFDKDKILILLHYFSIYNQNMQIVQFLIANKDISIERIFEYIQSDFIANNGDDMFLGLKETMNSLKCEKTKLMLYTMNIDGTVHIIERDATNYLQSSANLIPIVFQINPMAKQLKDDLVRLRYEIHTLWKSYGTAIDYINRPHDESKIFNLSYKYQQIDQLNNNFKAYLSNQTEKKLCYSFEQYIEKINDFKDGKSVEFEVDIQLKFDMLRDHINYTYFDFCIDPKNIEITNKNNGEKVMYLDSINDDDINEDLSFEIVPYDVSKWRYTDILYEIEIFVDTDCPFPFSMSSEKRKSRRISVGKGGNSINSSLLFFHHIMKQIQHEFFSDEFEHVIKWYKLHKHDRLLLDWYLLDESHEQSLLYMDHPLTSPMKYSWDYKPHYTASMKLFLIPLKYESKRNIQVRVKFAWTKTFDTQNIDDVDEVNEQCIGLPLIVLINKEDTLEYVINNKFIKPLQTEIDDLYQVTIEWDSCGINLISKNIWNSYNLYQRFAEDNDNGFILLTLRDNDNINASKYTLERS